jgi:hypothetical protein
VDIRTRVHGPLRAVILLGLASGLLAQRPAGYRDPQGRFTVSPPGDWKTVQLNGDAVQFANGQAYLSVLTFGPGEASTYLEAMGRQFGGQWRSFREAHRGPAKVGGRNGQYVTYQGSNPNGVDAFLELIAVDTPSNGFLLMLSAPAAEFARFQTAFDQMEKSFAAGGGNGPQAPSLPPPAAPMPAGTSRGALARASPPASSAPQAATRFVPAATPPPASAQPAYYRMKRVTVTDQRGFERPMTALSLLIPSDWQFQGSVEYAKVLGCHANLVQVVFRAASPDGRFAFEMFPGNTWQWADDQNAVQTMRASNQQMAQFNRRGCDVAPPATAAQFIQQSVMPAIRRQARVAGIEAMPEISREVQRKVQEMQASLARQGIQVRARSDVGRARIRYDLNGQQVEEWITAITYASGQVGPTFNMYTNQMGQSLFYTCAAEGVYGFRAPQGQLDAREKLLMMMLSTVRVEPEWHARVLQVIANMNAADAKGAVDRGKIIAQSGRDTADIIHRTFEGKKASDERVAQGFSQYIRGVESYRNPRTGETVELSNQYGHAWAGGNGEYILSDSANFDPNVALRGGNYTRMEAVRR